MCPIQIVAISFFLNKNVCRLMTKYCKKEKLNGKKCLCFRYGFDLVKPADSPMSLGIQDGDVIFAQTF